MKVCLVGSSGGHLTHLYMLKPFWKDKERFWVTFDKEDYETLNGFLIDKLEHIPGEDETCVVDYDGYRFTVLQIDNNIIQTVKIEKVFEA